MAKPGAINQAAKLPLTQPEPQSADLAAHDANIQGNTLLAASGPVPSQALGAFSLVDFHKVPAKVSSMMLQPIVLPVVLKLSEQSTKDVCSMLVCKMQQGRALKDYIDSLGHSLSRGSVQGS